MFDRDAAFAMTLSPRYPSAYGYWRFSDARSAQFATSDRHALGGHTTRRQSPSRSLTP